jgi:uncharacterized protein YxeA
MKALLIIITVVFVLIIVIGFFALMTAIQESACEDCPYRKVCEKHQADKSYLPPCLRQYMMHQNEQF